MNDERIVRKYEMLVANIKNKAATANGKKKEVEYNTAITIKYIQDHIDDIKSFSSSFMKVERCSKIINHMENQIGRVDKTAVYKELRKKGIIDFFDQMFIGSTIFIWVLYFCISSVEPNIYPYTHFMFMGFTVFLILLFKFMRYVCNE